MERILANQILSISDFKKNPIAAMEAAEGEPIAVLSNNKTKFYCIDKEMFELLMDALEDAELTDIVEGRLQEGRARMKANF